MKASLPYKYITSVKNGKQYVVFDYKDSGGKRKQSLTRSSEWERLKSPRSPPLHLFLR